VLVVAEKSKLAEQGQDSGVSDNFASEGEPVMILH
jgi:hypothetical protein